MIDVDRMREIAQALYSPMVEASHGDRGTRALRDLLEFLQALYKHLAPDARRTRILVLKHLEDVPVAPLVNALECPSVSHMPKFSPDPIVIQVLQNGRSLVSQTAIVDPAQAAQECVVYTYEERVEKFYARAFVRTVPNPAVGYASIFAVPTFDDLSLALVEYRDKLARKTSCEILFRAWDGQKRIVFKSAPESTMRNSLTRFLRDCLRGDVEVRPEQNVTPTRPVDIKVTWFMSNRLALIEIKWLGASKTGTGTLVRYSDSRARGGAKQLADYLEGNAVQAPRQETRGYLVVLDGRCGRVKPSTVTINHADGFKYEHSEIVFEPKYHEIRSDFEVPIRMFMEPVCD